MAANDDKQADKIQRKHFNRSFGKQFRSGLYRPLTAAAGAQLDTSAAQYAARDPFSFVSKAQMTLQSEHAAQTSFTHRCHRGVRLQ